MPKVAFLVHCYLLWGLPWWLRWSSVCLEWGRPRFDPWVGKIPWRRKWEPTPVLSPGKFHRLRSLVGYSPWGRKESDTTEQLHFTLHAFPQFLQQFLPKFRKIWWSCKSSRDYFSHPCREDCPCLYSLPGQPPEYPLILSKPNCFRTPSEKIIQGMGFLLCPSPTSSEVSAGHQEAMWLQLGYSPVLSRVPCGWRGLDNLRWLSSVYRPRGNLLMAMFLCAVTFSGASGQVGQHCSETLDQACIPVDFYRRWCCWQS